MAQCRGKTKKGERCRRDALEGSGYCSMHEPEASAGDMPRAGWEVALEEMDDRTKTVLGFAVVGTIVYLALRFGRMF